MSRAIPPAARICSLLSIQVAAPARRRMTNRVWSCGSVMGSSTSGPLKYGSQLQQPPGCGSNGSECGIEPSYAIGSSPSQSKTR